MLLARATQICATVLLATQCAFAGQISLLNVSYDPTRELYQDVNQAFSAQWQAKTGEDLTIQQSHGGSGRQARAVIEGLDADVVTLALASDIDEIAAHGLISKNWQSRLKNHSAPYTSTIVFLVRKGNPKKIRDWSDLIRPGVSVITSNPKTSGGARWIYLAAWGYALKKNDGNEASAKAYLRQLYQNVPVLASGSRGATTTFVERGIGDVLLTWENEALLAVNELGTDKVEIVTPSVSILAQPVVAVVDANVDRHGTRKVAQAYLEYLYSDNGQDLVGKHYFRPISAKAQRNYDTQFHQVNLFTVDEVAGSLTKAQQIHFSDGGIFDQIYQMGRK